jgi:hypothetical protein
MPRAALFVAILVFALGACRERPSESCDRDALAKLSEALATMSRADQANHVWPGLVDACADAIPAPLAIYFEPLHDPHVRWAGVRRERGAWTLELQRAACPSWDADKLSNNFEFADNPAGSAFVACDFARYEVLAADEADGQSPAIMTFAMHQWLLDQGVDARTAAPITRALFALEQIRLAPF